MGRYLHGIIFLYGHVPNQSRPEPISRVFYKFLIHNIYLLGRLSYFWFSYIAHGLFCFFFVRVCMCGGGGNTADFFPEVKWLFFFLFSLAVSITGLQYLFVWLGILFCQWLWWYLSGRWCRRWYGRRSRSGTKCGGLLFLGVDACNLVKGRIKGSLHCERVIIFNACGKRGTGPPALTGIYFLISFVTSFLFSSSVFTVILSKWNWDS